MAPSVVSPSATTTAASEESAAHRSSKSHNNVPLGAAIAILLLFILVGVIVLVRRMRHRRAKSMEERKLQVFRKISIRIFDSEYEKAMAMPSHRGSLRLAKRLSNGSWNFSEPLRSHSPQGISDPEPRPSLTSTRSREDLRYNPNREDRLPVPGAGGVAEPPPAYHPHPPQYMNGL